MEQGEKRVLVLRWPVPLNIKGAALKILFLLLFFLGFWFLEQTRKYIYILDSYLIKNKLNSIRTRGIT